MAGRSFKGLREVYSDFNEYERLPDGRVRIALGPQPISVTLEPLADAHDGEIVALVLPDELEAKGTLRSEMSDGDLYWYAMLPSWESIRNIHPEAVAESESAREQERQGSQAS